MAMFPVEPWGYRDVVPKDSAKGGDATFATPPCGLSSAWTLLLPWGEALGTCGPVGRVAGTAALYMY